MFFSYFVLFAVLSFLARAVRYDDDTMTTMMTSCPAYKIRPDVTCETVDSLGVVHLASVCCLVVFLPHHHDHTTVTLQVHGQPCRETKRFRVNCRGASPLYTLSTIFLLRFKLILHRSMKRRGKWIKTIKQKRRKGEESTLVLPTRWFTHECTFGYSDNARGLRSPGYHSFLRLSVSSCVSTPVCAKCPSVLSHEWFPTGTCLLPMTPTWPSGDQ